MVGILSQPDFMDRRKQEPGSDTRRQCFSDQVNECMHASDLIYIKNSMKPCLEIICLKVNIKYP